MLFQFHSALQGDSSSLKKSIFDVQGMTCSACVATIENYVKSSEGVEAVSVGLLQEKAEVLHNPNVITVTFSHPFVLSDCLEG